MSLMSERLLKTKQKFWVIVPAAGSGTRMQSIIPKQYLEVSGKTIIEHTLHRLLSCESVQGIVVCISRQDKFWSNNIFAQHDKIITVHGGQERMHSVYNALNYLRHEVGLNEEFILVHDAARPCVSVSDIEKLINTCVEKRAGAILASASIDTLKKVNQDGLIESTLNREQVWRAQTPQMFQLSVLLQSIEHMLEAGEIASDEAAAVEKSGFPAYIVEGSQQNIKLTKPEDIDLIKNILQMQKTSESKEVLS